MCDLKRRNYKKDKKYTHIVQVICKHFVSGQSGFRLNYLNNQIVITPSDDTNYFVVEITRVNTVILLT